jgi:hypothetical protein
MRYELTDHEWAAIKPMLPNKPRGVPRVNDRLLSNDVRYCTNSGRKADIDLGPAASKRTLLFTRHSFLGGVHVVAAIGLVPDDAVRSTAAILLCLVAK